MTTARAIITSGLTLRLNRLSPGETLDADLGALCLFALNEVVDECNGNGAWLWRDVLTPSAAPVSGAVATIGSTWPGLIPGCNIIGASYTDNGVDVPMRPMTMAQYQAIPIKTTIGRPDVYAYDGLSSVYLYSRASGQTITLLTGQPATAFADLDTDYTMPQGHQSHLASLLAERVAVPLLGSLPASVARSASIARRALSSRMEPAMLNHGTGAGRLADFLSGI